MQNMVAPVLNEAMNQLSGKVMENVLLGTKQHEGIVEKKKGFPVVLVHLMGVNGCRGKHSGDIDVEPLVLAWR